MNGTCPYCLQQPTNSDDHIFPKFLGGSKTIASCAQCNNGFGHRFEYSVSKDLAPIIVLLGFSGYKHRSKEPVTFKRAWVDKDTGLVYDVNSERELSLNEPLIEKDGGKIKRVVARSPKEARKIAASLTKKHNVKITFQEPLPMPDHLPPVGDFSLTVGMDTKRVAVKMCVAAAQAVVPDIDLVDESYRTFLLGDADDLSKAWEVYSRFPNLDANRPPLAHTVYVEGDTMTHKSYGVVQFFGGVFQLYVPLSSSYTGRDFSVLGTLDITTFQEQFKEIEPLRLPETSPMMTANDLIYFKAEWAANFNAQIKEAFGQCAVEFGPILEHSVTGVQQELPLVWIEYKVDLQVQMELDCSALPPMTVSLSANPSTWLISSDFGKTRLTIFETFIRKWNDRLLDRTPGREHVYVAEELSPDARLLIAEGTWCPLSMTIRYRVDRQAWLSSLDLSKYSLDLEVLENLIQTKFAVKMDDIPTQRDPSWPTITDIDGYLASVEHKIVVEPRLTTLGFRS